MGAAVPLQSRCTPFPSQQPPGIPMDTHRKTAGRGLIHRNWGAGSMQSHQQFPKTWAERGSTPKLLSVKTSLTFLVME